MHWFERTRPWRALRWAAGDVRYRVQRRAWTRADPKRPTLLAINHFIDSELKALRLHGRIDERLQVIPVHHWNLFTKNYWYFPPIGWTDRLPYGDPALARARERSRRGAARILDDVMAHVDLRGILTPSDQLWWLREFVAEARSRGVRVLVYDKEGTISPASFDHHSGWIRRNFPPISDRYYVWSGRQRDFWLRCGAGPERIELLGALRTDLYVNMPPPARKAVLLFDFDPTAYLDHTPAGTGVFAPPAGTAPADGLPKDWSGLKQEIHGVLQQAARDHPDVPFTVKLHPQQRDLEEVRRRFPRSAFPNVTIRTGSVGVDEIVAEHSIVLGFQTTALMEAALTQRPTIYCGWGAMHEALLPHLVPLMQPGHGTHWCRSPEELRTWLEGHLDGTWSKPRPPRQHLEGFFHQADGHVAERYVEAFCDDLGVPGPAAQRAVAAGAEGAEGGAPRKRRSAASASRSAVASSTPRKP